MVEEKINIQDLMKEIKNEAQTLKQENPIDTFFVPMYDKSAFNNAIFEKPYPNKAIVNFPRMTEEERKRAGIASFTPPHIESSVQYERPISGNFITRFIKKFITKIMRPVLWPIVHDQNVINQQVMTQNNILNQKFIDIMEDQYYLKQSMFQMHKDLYTIEKEQFYAKNKQTQMEADIYSIETKEESFVAEELNQFVHSVLEKDTARLKKQYESLEVDYIKLQKKISEMEKTIGTPTNA